MATFTEVDLLGLLSLWMLTSSTVHSRTQRKEDHQVKSRLSPPGLNAYSVSLAEGKTEVTMYQERAGTEDNDSKGRRETNNYFVYVRGH